MTNIEQKSFEKLQKLNKDKLEDSLKRVFKAAYTKGHKDALVWVYEKMEHLEGSKKK